MDLSEPGTLTSSERVPAARQVRPARPAAPEPPVAPMPHSYCPCCLQAVRLDDARLLVHYEACHSGSIAALLFQCPACELVLAAEVQVDSWCELPAP